MTICLVALLILYVKYKSSSESNPTNIESYFTFAVYLVNIYINLKTKVTILIEHDMKIMLMEYKYTNARHLNLEEFVDDPNEAAENSNEKSKNKLNVDVTKVHKNPTEKLFNGLEKPQFVACDDIEINNLLRAVVIEK